MYLPFKFLHPLFDFHQTWNERYTIGVLTNNIQSDYMQTVSIKQANAPNHFWIHLVSISNSPEDRSTISLRNFGTNPRNYTACDNTGDYNLSEWLF